MEYGEEISDAKNKNPDEQGTLLTHQKMCLTLLLICLETGPLTST